MYDILERLAVYRSEHSFAGPISSLIVTPQGEWLVAFREAHWRGYCTHYDPTTRMSLIRSTDQGRSWHSQVSPDPAGGNGACITQLRDGELLVNAFHWDFVPLSRADELKHRSHARELPEMGMAVALGDVFVARSVADGYAWQPIEQPASTQPFFMATTAGRIVERDDGALIMPLNARERPDAPVGLFVTMSPPGDARGSAWHNAAPIAPDGFEGCDLHETKLLVLDDDHVLAMSRTQDRNFVAHHSRDGGASWEPGVETPIWCGGSSPGDLIRLRDGRILCTYGHRRDPLGVRACVSDDGGETWRIENEIVLRDDGPDTDMGYPSSAQLDNGDIVTIYYWHDSDDPVRRLEGVRWRLAD